MLGQLMFGVCVRHSVFCKGFFKAGKLFGRDFARGLPLRHDDTVGRGKLSVQAVNFGGGGRWWSRIMAFSVVVVAET